MPAFVDLERDNDSVGGERTGEIQRRDTDRCAHLEHPPRAGRERQHVQQPAGLRDDDRDPVSAPVLLHLREQLIRLGSRGGEIFSDGVGDDHRRQVRLSGASAARPRLEPLCR